MEWLLLVAAGLLVELVVIVALGRRATGAYGTADRGAPVATADDGGGALLRPGGYRDDEAVPPAAVGA